MLLNASPDLAEQIRATEVLHPRQGPRHSPISAVALTGGEVDQIAGLLNLRERQAFDLYATAPTLALIEANPMFGVLARDTVKQQSVSFGAPFETGGVAIELFPVPGKVPLYKEEEGVLADTTAGVEVRSRGASLVFIPGAAAMTDELRERIARADVVLFDATVFTDDEMVRAGAGTKTGRRMGHMPIDGEDGTLKALAGLTNRRILIHINNTNPILIDGSPERRRVEQAGWEVAEDGQEIVL